MRRWLHGRAGDRVDGGAEAIVETLLLDSWVILDLA